MSVYVKNDRLTDSGQALANILEKVLPATPAGRLYADMVLKHRFYTSAGFFRDYPAQTNALASWALTNLDALVNDHRREMN